MLYSLLYVVVRFVLEVPRGLMAQGQHFGAKPGLGPAPDDQA